MQSRRTPGRIAGASWADQSAAVRALPRYDPRAMQDEAAFDRFAKSFLGLDRSDRVFEQVSAARRVYLATTATALMPEVVWRGLERYLESACANSHTEAHRAGRDTTRAIEASRDAIGRLVGYQSERDVVLFTANGATGAINFLARALFPAELRSVNKRFPGGAPPELLAALRSGLGDEGRGVLDEMLERPLVVVTMMEHHSNLIPWMEAVGHHNLRAVRVDPATGALDLSDLARVLETEGRRVRLVAVTGVSNVTGIVNPVHRIAAMAHAVGAQILVDGAQWVPHARVEMHGAEPGDSLDYLVLSGHKLYAPGSRGALIGSLETLSGRRGVTDVGGGMVEYVSINDFEIKDDVAAREEAGTPNIPGSIAMGLVAETLLRIGMDLVAEREHRHLRQHGSRRRAQSRRGVVQHRGSASRAGRGLSERLSRYRRARRLLLRAPLREGADRRRRSNRRELPTRDVVWRSTERTGHGARVAGRVFDCGRRRSVGSGAGAARRARRRDVRPLPERARRDVSPRRRGRASAHVLGGGRGRALARRRRALSHRRELLMRWRREKRVGSRLALAILPEPSNFRPPSRLREGVRGVAQPG